MPPPRDSKAADLDALYRAHAPTVFRRARRVLGSEADAHEIVQDVFMSLYQNPEQFAGKSSVATFLYGVTTHACLNRLRNQRNRQRLLSEQVAPAAGDTSRPLSPEDLSLLHDSLRRMPEELAQVAVLYCVDGLTHEDIAQVLDCSRRHVGDLLERFRRWEEATTC
jgi:RNA polymerase sigma-70 factor (ECF subfamily)